MGNKGDAAEIRRVIEVLQDIVDIAVRTGENELLNAGSREARILMATGEALLANANPHVEDREELEKWAQDCADLADYISPSDATLRH